MNGNSLVLEIDKCVASRLWYTTWIIMHKEIDTLPDKCNRDEILRMISDIQFDSHSQNKYGDQWIIFKILQLLAADNVAANSSHIEFCLGLKFMSKAVSSDVEKELLDLFRNVLDSKNVTETIDGVTGDALKFLKEGLERSPVLACRVIKSLLCVWSEFFIESDAELQNLYIESLKEHLSLEKIITRKLTANVLELKNAFQLSFDNDSSICEEATGTLLSILSKLELTEAKNDQLLTWIFPALFVKCKTTDVELALYARRSNEYLKEWVSFVDKTLMRTQFASCIENACVIGDAIFTSDNQNVVRINSRELAYRTIKQSRHWLLDILDICCSFLAAGYPEKVSKLLSLPILQELWPAVFFKVLNYSLNISELGVGEDQQVSLNLSSGLRFVLEKCRPFFVGDEIWNNIHTSTENQLDIVHWVLKNKKITAEKEFGREFKKDLTIKHVLSLLLSNGVLFTLNTTTNLHEGSCKEIECLLKISPNSMVIFKAFYAMFCALRAVVLSDCYSSSAQDIGDYLMEMKDTLANLLPLDVRLEAIENIFSMLFLRYEDFHHADSNYEDSEGELNEKKVPESDYKSIQSGFVCNKYILRDLLHYLKDTLLDLEVECTNGKVEHESSDSIDQIKRNVANVKHAIIDAVWRLELLTSSEFVNNVGCRKSETSGNQEELSFSEILLTKKLNSSKLLTNKSIFYKEDNSSSSEDYSRSEAELSCDAGSVENSTSNSGIRKKHWKKNVVDKHLIINSNYSFILNFMLSSMESLIIQCLWKCDFEKAQQVIKMFQSSDSQLDGEVRFSKAICQFRQKMKENVEPLSPADAINKEPGMSTLQNIRQAVQKGIQTSRLTGQLETFLVSNKSMLRLINPDEANTNEILTMAVLDLALTTGNSRSCSLNACEIATKYLKSCKVIEKTTHVTHFSKICNLFYESRFNAPLPSMLCDVTIPLSIQKCNERVEFWIAVNRIIQIFTESRSGRGNRKNELEHSRFIQSQGGMELIRENSNGEPYLFEIFEHLRILQSILPKTTDGNYEGTFHDMLEVSIQSYFGHQYFDMGATPEELDVVAKKLQVNLVHSILISCCPKFSFTEKLENIPTSNESGYFVLNENPYTVLTEYDMEKPNECVTGILQDLLDSIYQFYPNKSMLTYADVQNLSNIPKIQEILCQTSCFKKLNLCELAAGNETLTFFLNIWNLLFLHSMLTIWSSNAPHNRLQHIVSSMKICYVIGELGLVSLATLRSKLLGNLNWDFELFKHIEDFNELAWQDLDLTQDPRVIFVMANEFFGSPAIQVYDSKSVDKVLNTAIHKYIACYHLIDKASEESKIDICWLPEPVRRYQDFLLENSSLACQTVDLNFDESFTLRKFLNTSENNLEFKYRTQLHRYEIKLNYSKSKSMANDFGIMHRYSNNILLMLTHQSRIVDTGLLHYFEGHCWLLSYLVHKIHETTPVVTSNMQRCACLENLLRSSWTEVLRNTFDENQALVGMNENISLNELWAYFESLIKKNKWKQCLNVINCLPDNFTSNYIEIQSLKDKVLGTLVSAQELDSCIILQYLRQIKDIHVLASAILSNLRRWPVQACEQALMYILHHSLQMELPPFCRIQINANLHRVTAFQKMLPHFENNEETKHITWYSMACTTNRADLLKIVKSLIEANKFELCLEWLKYYTISTEIQSLVTQDLFIGLLNNGQQNFQPATKLLQALPISHSIKLCNGVIKKLQSIPAIKFVTNYLLHRCKPVQAAKYYKISISIEILCRLDIKERSAFAQLLNDPLLMLEQLLMNGKFEILHNILNCVSEILPKAEISLEDIDKMVRYYARKSLEFRVALQRDGIESKSKESTSLNNEMENTEFVMPSKVPTKDEWVPNDKSRICSCCKSVVFSMFNRRHHCRRCGRVVCAICSQQRMRVPTYPDSMHVRVCDDCKRQSVLRMHQQYGAPSTPSSETFDYWRLTTDESHNQTVRDEFSFEYAPSISLCLAILNLHSDHKVYASFLLDRCDEIKQLLQPVGSGRANPEVDHKLLVKMIRSLSVAAKVKYAKLSLNSGLDNCDRLLSHVDLVATLVQSDCSALVPPDKLDEHAVRRLRDLLTEREQWILALDVSTKSGLDRQGVWAAWGKAYLKVGCYDQAREKFAHCLDKVSTDTFEDWVFLPNSSQAEKVDSPTNLMNNEKLRMREKTRPTKNPPLLTEILQILESSTFNRQSRRSVISKSFTAHDISVTLNNIKAISQGRYYDVESAMNTDNTYYHESLHYLLSYGSHSSIADFFLKHEKYEECLLHVLDNKVDSDIFFNSIYLPCLKTGCIEKLHEAMRAKDANLIVWKSYLVFTCHSLETKKFLNTLYQLQLFTKDYVRASISCIRFYVNGATDYTDLCSRSQFLHQAQKHLETELQAQTFGPKRRKSTGSQNSGQSTLTLELEPSDIDRHINTVSRQLEIAKFLRNSEQEGRNARKFLNDLSSMENDSSKVQELPTLFGTQLQRTQLAVLAILCGRDVEEGFGIAFRIIQDYNLRSEKVYSLAGHILASEQRISSVEQLVKCCRSSGAPDTNALSDRVLAHCVKVILNSNHVEQPVSSSKDKVDTLIKLITDLELKISMCIESRQLKAAYLLAVRHSRAQDVRKIFKEADRLEQNAIKAICAKWLQQAQKF